MILSNYLLNQINLGIIGFFTIPLEGSFYFKPLFKSIIFD